MLNYKKIILEQISYDEVDRILDKSSSLRSFILDKKTIDNGSIIRKFVLKDKSYLVNLYIIKDKKNKWSSEIYVYWKTKTKDFTPSRGKEIEFKFGPFSNIEELIEKLNNTLKNNLVVGNEEIYHDNQNDQQDELILSLISDLKEDSEFIQKFLLKNKDIFFDDFKKMFEQLKKLNSEEEIRKFLDKEFNELNDKQKIILILQKKDKIKFYKDMEKSNHRNIF